MDVVGLGGGGAKGKECLWLTGWDSCLPRAPRCVCVQHVTGGSPAFSCRSGSTLHFLTCQHGQAKHRAFWHRHFTPLVLTDNSNLKEAWHGVNPGQPPRPGMRRYSLERGLSSTAAVFTTLVPGEENVTVCIGIPEWGGFFSEFRSLNVVV